MKEIKEFKQQIKNKEYYQAHEVLEKIWFPIRKHKDDFTYLLKGFINAAVSLELYKRGKIEQSKKIYLIYKKYVVDERIENSPQKKSLKSLQKYIDTTFEEIYKI